MEVQLTEEQVDYVWQELSDGSLREMRLKAELVDHFCCHMEESMSAGVSFEEAYEAARQAITPYGAGNIQEEDDLMMSLAKQKTMKKFFYLSAFLSTFLIMAGFLFRILHNDLGSLALLAGNFCLLFGVLPAVVVFFIRNLQFQSVPDRIRLVAGVAGGAVFSVGSMFKVLHYPLADTLSVAGLLALLLVFLPLFFWQLYRRAV